MALDSYSGLKASLQSYLDRDDVNTDDLIDLAEARFAREIRMREQIKRATVSTNGTRYLDLPEDFLEMRLLRLLTDPVTVLKELSVYELAQRRTEDTGRPSYFTENGVLEFDKVPSDTYTVEMYYWEQLTPLSGSASTNILLRRAPDAYLYACLLAAEPFIMNDERIPMWEKLYSAARDAINQRDARRAGPLISQPSGARP